MTRAPWDHRDREDPGIRILILSLWALALASGLFALPSWGAPHHHLLLGLEHGDYEVFHNGVPIDTLHVGDSTWVEIPELPEGGSWVVDELAAFYATGPGRFDLLPLGMSEPDSVEVFPPFGASMGTVAWYIQDDSWGPVDMAGRLANGFLPFVPGYPVYVQRFPGWKRYIFWWFWAEPDGDWNYYFEVLRRESD